MQNTATIPWYPDAVEYESFRRSAEDPEVFFDCFNDWLAVALEHERRAQERGILIIRIRMKLDAFLDWARASSHGNDLAGRSAFAEACGRDLLPSG